MKGPKVKESILEKNIQTFLNDPIYLNAYDNDEKSYLKERFQKLFQNHPLGNVLSYIPSTEIPCYNDISGFDLGYIDIAGDHNYCKEGYCDDELPKYLKKDYAFWGTVSGKYKLLFKGLAATAIGGGERGLTTYFYFKDENVETNILIIWIINYGEDFCVAEIKKRNGNYLENLFSIVGGHVCSSNRWYGTYDQSDGSNLIHLEIVIKQLEGKEYLNVEKLNEGIREACRDDPYLNVTDSDSDSNTDSE